MTVVVVLDGGGGGGGGGGGVFVTKEFCRERERSSRRPTTLIESVFLHIFFPGNSNTLNTTFFNIF